MKKSRRLTREPDPDDLSVGADLVRLRIARQMSQEELADAAQVDQASVSRVERNLVATTKLLDTLCAVLGARVRLVPDDAGGAT